jgi:lipopolysaccharide/colanic/teichoic acid biosynthesis glycosyltransferase
MEAIPENAKRGASYDFLKRMLDIIGSATLLVVLSPLLAAVGLYLKIAYGGTVVSRTLHVGRFGRLFLLYNFRTNEEVTNIFTPEGLSTVRMTATPAGRALRRMKLDKIPELVNVLKGDMSLVGPKPAKPNYVHLYEPGLRDLILLVKPGITGPMQLKYRVERRLLEQFDTQHGKETYMVSTLLPIKCELEAQYVVKRSLLLDVMYVLLTASLKPRRQIVRTTEALLAVLVREKVYSPLTVGTMLITAGNCYNAVHTKAAAKLEAWLGRALANLETGEEVLDHVADAAHAASIVRSSMSKT